MGNSIRINSNKLPIRDYNGQRVVTFKDIDTVHERKDGTAKRNFYTNRERFIEGVDYFKITAYEFRTLIGEMDSRQQNDVILLTESGYLMLAKSFTDDLAWKVQRELVNNYFRGKSPEPPKAPALETAEYHYFPKTLNGVPVITVADFVHFTGLSAHSVYKALKRDCKLGEEYFSLSGAGIAQYKRENPNTARLQSVALVLKESAVRKLLKHFKLSVEIPMIEEKQQPIVKPKTKRSANEILNERKITRDDCIIALDVLRCIESNCENNVKMAACEGRSTQFYGRELSEVQNVIKGVGMLLVMGC